MLPSQRNTLVSAEFSPDLESVGPDMGMHIMNMVLQAFKETVTVITVSVGHILLGQHLQGI